MNLSQTIDLNQRADLNSALYDLELELISGDTLKLSDYQDHAILIVNTASKCGFTPQYKGLEMLHQKYSSQGLLLIACPCNQFGEQEPGQESEIQEFCEINYQVRFPMTKKLLVNGPDTHPLFRLLKEEARGLLNSTKIKWNFTKFLIAPSGGSIQRFSPMTTPRRIETQLRKLLS